MVTSKYNLPYLQPKSNIDFWILGLHWSATSRQGQSHKPCLMSKLHFGERLETYRNSFAIRITSFWLVWPPLLTKALYFNRTSLICLPFWYTSNSQHWYENFDYNPFIGFGWFWVCWHRRKTALNRSHKEDNIFTRKKKIIYYSKYDIGQTFQKYFVHRNNIYFFYHIRGTT